MTGSAELSVGVVGAGIMGGAIATRLEDQPRQRQRPSHRVYVGRVEFEATGRGPYSQ